MNVGDILTTLHEWEVNEEDVGAHPAFLLHQEDDTLNRARDLLERMKMHIDDVLNYRRDMEEYQDGAI